AVGTDGGKKVRGRKRHLAVDTLGLLLAVAGTAAKVHDAGAGPQVFPQMPREDLPGLGVVPAGNKDPKHPLHRTAAGHHQGYVIDVVSGAAGERRCVPLRSRWVAERTLAWLGRYRRLSKDYERTTASSEAVLKVAGIHHYLRRLSPQRVAKSQRFRFEGHQPK